MSRPSSARVPRRPSPSRRHRGRNNKQHEPNVADFLDALDGVKLVHYGPTLLNYGFNLTTFQNISERDLTQLRITNKKDRAQLLGLAERLASAVKTSTDAQQEEQVASPPVSPNRHATHEGSVPSPTANEFIRQATTFLEHHKVSRPWPRSSSPLAATLSLSHAEPVTKGQTLYAVKVEEREPAAPTAAVNTSVASQRSVKTKTADGEEHEIWHPSLRVEKTFPPAPPVKRTVPVLGKESRVELVTRLHSMHGAGHSSQFCEVCEQFVNDGDVGGQWQFQQKEIVATGDGASEVVSVWVPFEPYESMMLEHARRQQIDRMRLGKYSADLTKMMWGPCKIRRATSRAIPFPSLSKKEITPTPEYDPSGEDQLKDDLDESFRKLVLAEEQRGRYYIIHCEAMARDEMKEEMWKMIEETHRKQKLSLEAEEEAARKKIFDSDFHLAIDKVWEEAEKAVQEVKLGDARRSSDNIAYQQRLIIEQMETINREHIENEEAAARTNFEKLVARFNAQVRAILLAGNAPVKMNHALRCELCRKADCVFLQSPWKGNWRHRGVEEPSRRPSSASSCRGAASSKTEGKSSKTEKNKTMPIPHKPRLDTADMKFLSQDKGHRTVSALLSRASELEYQEACEDEHRRKLDYRLSPQGLSETRERSRKRCSMPRAPSVAETGAPSADNEYVDAGPPTVGPAVAPSPAKIRRAQAEKLKPAPFRCGTPDRRREGLSTSTKLTPR